MMQKTETISCRVTLSNVASYDIGGLQDCIDNHLWLTIHFIFRPMLTPPSKYWRIFSLLWTAQPLNLTSLGTLMPFLIQTSHSESGYPTPNMSNCVQTCPREKYPGHGQDGTAKLASVLRTDTLGVSLIFQLPSLCRVLITRRQPRAGNAVLRPAESTVNRPTEHPHMASSDTNQHLPSLQWHRRYMQLSSPLLDSDVPLDTMIFLSCRSVFVKSLG